MTDDGYDANSHHDAVPGPNEETYIDEPVEDSGQAPDSSEEFAHGADGAVPEDKIEAYRQHEANPPRQRVSNEATDDL